MLSRSFGGFDGVKWVFGGIAGVFPAAFFCGSLGVPEGAACVLEGCSGVSLVVFEGIARGWRLFDGALGRRRGVRERFRRVGLVPACFGVFAYG